MFWGISGCAGVSIIFLWKTYRDRKHFRGYKQIIHQPSQKERFSIDYYEFLC